MYETETRRFRIQEGTKKRKDMRVFACSRQGGWEGGIILVAADSKNEAFAVAARDKDTFVHFQFFDKKGRYVESADQAATIKSKTYPIECWYQIKELSADVDKPKVILDEGYTE